MSRGVIFLVCLLAVVIFAALVHYGWTHRWGDPTPGSFTEPAVLAMPQVARTLELAPGDFDSDAWTTIAPATVSLLHQVTVAPWGKNLVPTIDVRAFHDGKDAYFLLEWQDQAESRTHDTGEFPDGVAVGFSMEKEPPSASIMMGFQSLVNIWQWKADLDAAFWGTAAPEDGGTSNVHYSYEKQAGLPARTEKPAGACQDLLSGRPGSVTRKEKTSIAGRGQWGQGRWRVIFKRALATGNPEEDVQLSPGKAYATFAVWNGEKTDRGSRKSISEWTILELGSGGGSVSQAGEGRQAEGRGAVTTKRLGSLGFPVFLLLASAEAAAPELPAASGEPRLVNVQAKRFEYMPNEITLQKGELVTLRLESLDVTHGLYLDGYGIDLKARPGMVGKATFVADKAGRFTFRCSETCGEFHPYMVGFVTVEPNKRWHVFVGATLGLGVLSALVVFVGATKRGAA